MVGLLSSGVASAGARAAANDPRRLVKDAAAAVRLMRQESGILESGLLRRTRAVLVVPDLVRAGVLVGGAAGSGVLLANRVSGWSDPAFYRLSAVTFGAQLGAQEAATVIFVLSAPAFDALTKRGGFALTGQAGLTAIDYAKAQSDDLLRADFVVWSKAQGAYVGLTLEGAALTQDQAADRAFYGRETDAIAVFNRRAGSRDALELRQGLTP